MKRPRISFNEKTVLYGLVSLLVLYLLWPNFLALHPSVARKQALVEVAVRHVMSSYPPSIELARRTDGPGRTVVTYGRPNGVIPYGSVDDFYTVNPHCCELVDRGAEGWEPSFLSWLFGLQYYIVRVRYAVRLPGEAGGVRTMPQETFVILTRSGTVTHD